MLYQARREDFYKEVPEPEYIVYVFINDQITRICTSVIDPFFKYQHLRYKIYNSRLEKEKFSEKYNLYMFRYYTIMKSKKLISDFNINMINEYFKETKEEFDKHWKNYKFVLLFYSDCDDIENIRNSQEIKELEKTGIRVISTKDLTGNYYTTEEKYTIYDGFHPNGIVWEEVIPELTKKLEEMK